MKKKLNIAFKVSIITIIINILLTIMKLLAGLFAHSQAMVSDAIHSLSDVLSTIIVIIGIKISSKKADDKHPYGHERFECVSAIILSIMLFLVGLFIGYKGVLNLITNKKIIMPGVFAIVAAILSIGVKEIMYWYTRYAAKKINSGTLLADAWHHRSDALSSIGSLIGVVGARIGFLKLDMIASIIICIFIFKVAFDIFKDAIDKMVDKSCEQETIDQIINIINNNKSIKNIDDLKTRQFGNKYYIDIEIAVDKSLSVFEGHKIAEDLHDEIENKMKLVKHCMVHVNPYLKK